MDGAKIVGDCEEIIVEVNEDDRKVFSVVKAHTSNLAVIVF